MESQISVGIIFDYLTNHIDNVQQDKFALKSFENLICEVLLKDNSLLLREILISHGWTNSGFFDDSVVFVDCLQALGNAYLSLCESEMVFPNVNEDSIFSLIPRILTSSINVHLKEFFAIPMLNARVDAIGMIVEFVHFVDTMETLASGTASDLYNFHKKVRDSLSCVVEIILKYGGDVISFEGVSIFCVFEDNKAEVVAFVATLPAAVRAILCGLEINSAAIPGSHALNTRVMVARGQLDVSVAGGNDDNWNYVMYGPCYRALLALQKVVAEHSLVVTVDCFEAVKTFVSDMSNGVNRVVKLSYAERDKGVIAVDSFELARSSTMFGDNDEIYAEDSELRDILKLFVAAPVMSAICGSSADSLLELRRVTVLCATMTTFAPPSAEEKQNGQDEIGMMQALYSTVQQVLASCGGYLDRFVECESGWKIVVIWGVPLSSYVNNCARSLYCALAISQQAALIYWRCSVGISTGSAVCCLLGCAERQDYVVMSRAVTQAELLVTIASGVILLAQSSYQQLSCALQATCRTMTATDVVPPSGMSVVYERFGKYASDPSMLNDYHELPNAVLQSKVSASLLRQLDKVNNSISGAHALVKQKSVSVMRSSSSSCTSARTASFKGDVASARADSSDPVFTAILGCSGMGKSTALTFVCQNAKRRALFCISVKCSQGDEANPFGLIAKIILDILGPTNFDTELKQRALILQILDEMEASDQDADVSGRWGKRYHAFKAFFGFNWNDDLETDETRPTRSKSMNKQEPISEGNEMDHQSQGQIVSAKKKDINMTVSTGRDDRTFADLLAFLLKSERVVIIIDDSQYCDELSWRQLYQTQVSVDVPLAVFFASRIGVNGHVMKPSGPTRQSVDQGYAPMSSESQSHSQSHMSSSFVSVNYSASDAHDGLYGKHFGERAQNLSYLAIIRSEMCLIIELSLLDRKGVMEVLTRVIADGKTVTAALVSSVHNFTGGNAYWCNTVAQFILHHGVDAYVESVVFEGFNTQSSLGALITSRYDMLSFPVQHVCKYASVIGEQFDLNTVKAILPQDTIGVWDHLEVLMQNNFISLVDENTATFEFQNSLIRATLYELWSPPVAADIHLSIAVYMEKIKSSEFPILSYHYRKAGNRYCALKYTVKSSKRCLRHGAFAESYAFLQAALPLAVTRPEIRAIKLLTEQAIRLIAPSAQPPGMSGMWRMRSSAAVADSTVAAEQARLKDKYIKLGEDMDLTLKYMTTGAKALNGDDNINNHTNKNSKGGSGDRSSKIIKEDFSVSDEDDPANFVHQDEGLCAPGNCHCCVS